MVNGSVEAKETLLDRTLSLPEATLAVANLATPAAFLFLLRPVLEGHAKIGNRPATWARGGLAITFLAAMIVLATGRNVLGRRVSCCAVGLNLCLILWFWTDSGVVFTIEIVGWLFVDALILLLVVLTDEQFAAHRKRNGTA